MVCSARGAADALDAVDWDALFQLSTRQAKRRLLFGTSTRRRRADVFWLWDEGLQQLRRRSWSRWLEPRQTAKRLRAGHDVVGSYRARTMEATRRRAGCAHASITSLPRLGFDNQAVVVFVCDVAPVKRPLASLARGRPPIPPPKTGPKLAELPCCIICLRVQETHCTKDAARKKRWRHRTSRRHLDQYFYLFFQLNGCQTALLTVLHHERFRPSDLLASWERAPIGCCWKGWINRLATKVIFNRDEALIS